MFHSGFGLIDVFLKLQYLCRAPLLPCLASGRLALARLIYGHAKVHDLFLKCCKPLRSLAVAPLGKCVQSQGEALDISSRFLDGAPDVLHGIQLVFADL
jgi:hypothetical protein